ncbi:hypothetical protein V1460_15485 [Streptomyces sp. SCSIO 30461]|uniref:hypothetical protein n=1 Tax=Streptomyces sp. SCSIO 30461 TaxID=3118085 RepID=UPI0030CA84E8
MTAVTPVAVIPPAAVTLTEFILGVGLATSVLRLRTMVMAAVPVGLVVPTAAGTVPLARALITGPRRGVDTVVITDPGGSGRPEDFDALIGERAEPVPSTLQ